MAMNQTEISQVLEEIAPALKGGWIQKIQQPNAYTLTFDIRVPGRTHRLLICCRPETSRLHFASCALPNPPTPPAFCQFLRAHFQGARIESVSQVPHDRLVELHCTNKEGARMIICELTGRQANVLVLNAERRVVRDLHCRIDRIGTRYNPPAKTLGSPREEQSSRFSDVAGGTFPISAAIESHYHTKESALSFDLARTARLRAIKKKMKKEWRLVEAWQADLAKAHNYRDYVRYGELIKANLGSIKKGADHITVIDYFDNRLPEVTIPLASAKSAQGNMEDYFRKHRKYLIAERELRPRIEHAEQDLTALRRELMAIEQGIWSPPAAQPAAPNAHKEARRPIPKGLKSGNQRTTPFRRFISTDGFLIFVGRNARENDDLTFGLAKSDDLWFHARGTPGSHVVVRQGKGDDPPFETIRDAATLALLYSDLKRSGKGDVIYTKRKWVKKAKGQAAGTVTVSQEKSMFVSLDRARLDQLKTRSE